MIGTDASPIPAAVLVAILKRPDGPAILFIRRTMTVSTHKGQIAFPGGAREPQDTSIEETALREAEEETSLPPASVQVLGSLAVQRTWTGFEVTPVVGLVENPPVLTNNPREVAQIFEVPSIALRSPGVFEKQVRNEAPGRFTDHRFHTSFGIIWGVTGHILYDFLNSPFV